MSLDEYKEQLDSFCEVVDNNKIEDWTIEQVLEFLEKIHMSHIIYLFKNNLVNGKMLIEMGQEELKHIGVYKKGDILCILDSIEKIKSINDKEKQKKFLKTKKLI